MDAFEELDPERFREIDAEVRNPMMRVVKRVISPEASACPLSSRKKKRCTTVCIHSASCLTVSVESPLESQFTEEKADEAIGGVATPEPGARPIGEHMLTADRGLRGACTWSSATTTRA